MTKWCWIRADVARSVAEELKSFVLTTTIALELYEDFCVSLVIGALDTFGMTQSSSVGP